MPDVPEVDGICIDDKACRLPDNFLNIERHESGYKFFVHVLNMPEVINQRSLFKNDLMNYCADDSSSPMMFSKYRLHRYVYGAARLPTLTLEVDLASDCTVINKRFYKSKIRHNKCKKFSFEDVSRIIANQSQNRSERLISDLCELAELVQLLRRQGGAVCGKVNGDYYDWLAPRNFSPGIFLVHELRILADFVLTESSLKLQHSLLFKTQNVLGRHNVNQICRDVERYLSRQNASASSNLLFGARQSLSWENFAIGREKFKRHTGYGLRYYAPFLAPRRKLPDLYNLSDLAHCLNLQENPLKDYQPEKILELAIKKNTERRNSRS